MSKKQAAPPRAVDEPKRVPKIDLSPLTADAPDPPVPDAVSAALMDPETKKMFEQLIVEIRRQGVGGNGEAPAGGVSQAAFDALKASVNEDLNNLRDSIMLITASLDNDTGVATDTYAAMADPPPITTA